MSPDVLPELVQEAEQLCDIDYSFGQADRDAKELRAWALISKLAHLKNSPSREDRDRGLADKLWANDAVMSLNAELGLSMDNLVKLAILIRQIE